MLIRLKKNPQKRNKKPRSKRLWWHTVWSVAVKLLVGLTVLIFLVIIALRFINPPFSIEMAYQKFYGQPVTQQWVPLKRISPQLIRAVVMAEDARFCQHKGVDWRQVERVWKQAIDGARRPRGASTIAMQTVKNLFLWPDRSYVRKALELPLAYMITAIWPKQRLMEIYLNIVEWGPGIYGAEMAARHHFNRSAAQLSAFQAALLAASLPNPKRRMAGRPNRHTRQIAAIIARRMKQAQPWVKCLR